MFLICLGYRRDYVGHYAAGYGGTLAALTVMQAALKPIHYARWAPGVALPGTLACMVLGAVAEATVFHLARFDEVDFCNQSIGAALAGMVVWSLGRQTDKPSDVEFLTCMAAGLVALLTGTYFAIT